MLVWFLAFTISSNYFPDFWAARQRSPTTLKNGRAELPLRPNVVFTVPTNLKPKKPGKAIEAICKSTKWAARQRRPTLGFKYV
jgi:hypothetical protein